MGAAAQGSDCQKEMNLHFKYTGKVVKVFKMKSHLIILHIAFTQEL